MLLFCRHDLNQFRFRHYRSMSFAGHKERGRLCFPTAAARDLRYSILARDLLFEQISQAGSGGRIGPVVLHRLLFFVNVLGLDRQRNAAALAIHVGELGLHFLADFQQQPRILDPVARQFGGAQLAVHAVAQIDDGTLGVHFAHDAANDAAFRVLRDVSGERILGELLDSQADALALRVDGQHHGVDLLSLLVAAHRLFARHVPGDIRQMHEAVDAARETDEDAEIGDRLDLSRDLVAAIVVLCELLPRVGLALLDAQADAAALLIDIEHHDLDFLADVHDLGG